MLVSINHTHTFLLQRNKDGHQNALRRTERLAGRRLQLLDCPRSFTKLLEASPALLCIQSSGHLGERVKNHRSITVVLKHNTSPIPTLRRLYRLSRNILERPWERGRLESTGVPRSLEAPPSYDPTAGSYDPTAPVTPHLGSDGGPKGRGYFL